MERSERFRDICEDLADAELALSRVDEAPPALREARRTEWQALVERLVGEVESELRDHSVPGGSRANPKPTR